MNMKFKKINIQLQVRDTTNPEKMANVVEDLIALLRDKGITQESVTRMGVTIDSNGESED